MVHVHKPINEDNFLPMCIFLVHYFLERWILFPTSKPHIFAVPMYGCALELFSKSFSLPLWSFACEPHFVQVGRRRLVWQLYVIIYHYDLRSWDLGLANCWFIDDGFQVLLNLQFLMY
jgi:hypothetical protein